MKYTFCGKKLKNLLRYKFSIQHKGFKILQFCFVGETQYSVAEILRFCQIKPIATKIKTHTLILVKEKFENVDEFCNNSAAGTKFCDFVCRIAENLPLNSCDFKEGH